MTRPLTMPRFGGKKQRELPVNTTDKVIKIPSGQFHLDDESAVHSSGGKSIMLCCVSSRPCSTAAKSNTGSFSAVCGHFRHTGSIRPSGNSHSSDRGGKPGNTFSITYHQSIKLFYTVFSQAPPSDTLTGDIFPLKMIQF